MDKDYYNASGCPDPTAYTAMQNIQHAEAENARKLIKELKTLVAANGFILLNRIELKNAKSGTIFK